MNQRAPSLIDPHIIIIENAMRCTIEIVILAASLTPHKGGKR